MHFFFKSSLGQKLMSSQKHYGHQHSKQEILYEIKHAIIPESVLSFITCLALSTKEQNPLSSLFSIRWEMSVGEFPRIILEAIGIFVVYEIYYYVVHYFMHKRAFYKAVHSVHHKSLYPTPQTGTSVNLLEAAVFYTFFILMIFGPFHILSLILIWGMKYFRSGFENRRF
jgi:sterol desaturase/sphingolipid hydroxylase (fatty acid hydroxylase superfamily)